MTLARIGAVFYVLWGLLHLLAAGRLLGFATGLEDEMLRARLMQGAWHMLFFALIAIVVGAWLNRRNSTAGYWINLVTVSVVDLGFIALLLVPGLVPLWPGLLGPALWLAAAAFSTAAMLRRPRRR